MFLQNYFMMKLYHLIDIQCQIVGTLYSVVQKRSPLLPGWYMVEVESEVLGGCCNAIISLPAVDVAQPLKMAIVLIDGKTTKRVIYLENSVKEIKIRTIDGEVLQFISNVRFVPLPERRARQLMQQKIKRSHPVLASLPLNQLQEMLREVGMDKLINKYDACFARITPAHLQDYWNRQIEELWWQTDELQLPLAVD